MTKPEGWRLDPGNYPVRGDFQTRFQDLDVNGHINNVAFAALFEGGRVMLNRQVDALANRPSNERTVVGDLHISYLGEGNFPDLVHIASGFGRLGRTSWTIHQAMFQNGRIIATCDTVIICRTDGQAKPLRDELRADLTARMAKQA
ncbi:thioesterase [Sphingobium sp. TA15]|uniref:Putative thioesterase n=1 Tax=Sphingobium indicum (strain DSM 16413 / CCM 7287 / MTCC 6362 / UT26 / NBRC 101211 / UT26S) TaxID=452662 RepID=D4Z3N1_SPHIU|nr:acyl-CoA thioesterase [Sphingobium indicum]BAI97213.1 putative thioesterase [Sphingobium indicum UT26S]BDD66634.1 thioesterase [Sphingobium sp. TA15]